LLLQPTWLQESKNLVSVFRLLLSQHKQNNSSKNFFPAWYRLGKDFLEEIILPSPYGAGWPLIKKTERITDIRLG
jgi:hypothetical protein